MLSPEYLDECSNQLINLYSELENRIIADITRRLLKTGDITETAKWEILKAQELGLLYDDVLSLIASQTDATSNHVKALFEDAGVETVNIDNQKYRKMGKTPIDIRQSDSMRQVLEAGYQKTLGNLKNLTMTTAITSQTTFINASNSAYMMVTSGAFSYQDAIRTAIKEMAQKGVSVLTDTIKYEGTNKRGQHYTHEDKIDVAIRRNILTGVGQTCKQVSLTNARENGFDLMEINAHSGARPSHAKWQGKRVSLSGRKGYLSLHDIGFGSAEGFGGCNCRHDWYPVDENDIPMYTDSQLQDFDAKNIEYNGKKYTQYEATQIQRRKEREIRALKREAVAYDTAIKETNDEELKSKLKDDFNNTSKKLKDKEQSLADFTKETGIKRDKFREQVQRFNRSVSSKSTWANKKSRNDLTSANNSGKMETELGKFKSRLRNDAEMEKEYSSALKTRFSHCSKSAQKAFNKYIPNNSVVNNHFEGVQHYTSNSRFEPVGIYMHYGMDLNNERGAGATWFHEHGHMIDDLSGNVSYRNEIFLDSLKKDYNDLLHKYAIKHPNLEYSEIYSLISTDLSDMRKHSAVSDLLHGLSKENIEGCATHPRRKDGSSYWNDVSLCQEAFAHMFECQSDSLRYDQMKKYFPNSLKTFEYLLERI